MKEFSAFADQDALYREQLSGTSWAPARDFLKTDLNYAVPSGVEPEDGSSPPPNQPIDFY